METWWLKHKMYQKLNNISLLPATPFSLSPSPKNIFKFHLYHCKVHFPLMEFEELVCRALICMQISWTSKSRPHVSADFGIVCSSRVIFNPLCLAGYTLSSISSIAVLPHVLPKFHFLISHQERKMKSYFPWKNFHFSDSHLVICDQICVHFCLPWRAFFEDRNLTYSITYSSSL